MPKHKIINRTTYYKNVKAAEVYKEFYKSHERKILNINIVARNTNLTFDSRLENALRIAEKKYTR